MMTKLEYLKGFGNTFCSEALPGALPDGQNNPQRCPYELYCEQLTGTAFTAPRARNMRSWLYRIHPSVQHSHMEPSKVGGLGLAKDESERKFHIDPNQMRWQPMEIPAKSQGSVTFVQGITQVAQSGDPKMKEGLAIYIYVANASMDHQCLTNADGDLLIVPQCGPLLITTEFGKMRVEPNEICVVQRGIRFSVAVESEETRGYILEVFSGHFILPDLGPIGANGLANPFDFESPVAWYEDTRDEWLCFTKFGGRMFEMTQEFSPFNVVAFKGNYVPYKYDLRKFNCMNSVTYDHPDPSIYTVLTCQSNEPGVAVADFVIFPPRWMVMEHSFRPPYFHRNTMTEYMGMIWGEYDAKVAKQETGFVPGGGSLHSCMIPHGPDAETFKKATALDSFKPEFFDKGLAFMFETTYILGVSDQALNAKNREYTYQDCWKNMPKVFKPDQRPNPSSGNNLLQWRKEHKSKL